MLKHFLKHILVISLLLLGAIPAWAQLPPTQCVSQAVAGGSPDAIQIPNLPCVPTTTLLILKMTGSNVTNAPTISIAGQTPYPITNYDGSVLAAGTLASGQYRLLSFNGSKWLLLSNGTVTNNNYLSPGYWPYKPGSCTNAVDSEFQGADASAHAASDVLLVYGCTVHLTQSYTMLSPVIVLNGALIQESSGNTLTLAGSPPTQLLNQMFDLSAGGLYGSTGSGNSWYPQWFGGIIDGTSHSGNAAALSAAFTASASNGTVVLTSGPCFFLDGEASYPGVDTITVQGQGSACMEPATNFTTSDGGMLYFGGTGVNVTMKGFYIDGNVGSNPTVPGFAMVSVANGGNLDFDVNVQNTTGDGEDLNGFTGVRVRGSFQNIGIISSSNPSGAAVNIGNNGCAEFNCSIGPSRNLDVDVSITNANYTGVGVGYGVGGHVTARCDGINPTGAWAECETGYYYGNTGIIYNLSVVNNGTGNHCIHLGGYDNQVYGSMKNCKYDGVLIESRYNETDGTVTVSGGVVTGSGGQTWGNCYHSCQRSSHYTDGSGMFRINGSSYFVDHCTSNTSCVLAGSPPTVTTPTPYLLTWFGPSYNDSVYVVTDNVDDSGAGLHAAVACNICLGGHLAGHGIHFSGQTEGIICADCGGTEVDFGSEAAYFAGVNVNSSFEVSTNNSGGTFNVTNGSAAFTGNGTTWLSNLAPGDHCKDVTNNDSFDMVVATVADNTDGTFTSVYPGTTGTNHNYVCASSSQGVLVNAAAIDALQVGSGNGGFGVLVQDSVYSMVQGNFFNAQTLGFNDAGANVGNVFFGLGTVPGSPVMGDIVPVTCGPGSVNPSTTNIISGVVIHC